MVVRTSYSGMQESVHNKTVDPATSFSFHCPSYQYPIFTGMHEFPYFLLSYNYNRKSKFFSFFILPIFFFNVTFIKLLLPLSFVSVYLQLQSKVKILLVLYSSIFFSMLYLFKKTLDNYDIIRQKFSFVGQNFVILFGIKIVLSS